MKQSLKLDQKSSDGIALIMIQNNYLLIMIGFVFASSALIYSCSITSVVDGRKWN